VPGAPRWRSCRCWRCWPRPRGRRPTRCSSPRTKRRRRSSPRPIAQALGRSKPTILEPTYPVFEAWEGEKLLGRAIVVEEIGKHRPITFIVGVEPDGAVAGISVMVYREAYGGEVRSSRFLKQYRGKGAEAPLLPNSDIRNITGATLSVQAIGRGVKKAIVVADVAGHGEGDALAKAGG
jgi:hypothetical protein